MLKDAIERNRARQAAKKAKTEAARAKKIAEAQAQWAREDAERVVKTRILVEFEIDAERDAADAQTVDVPGRVDS